MEKEYLRTIDELVERYELEPELRDLYVEGPKDKKLYEWFFKQLKCRSVSIFEIDSVNIDDKLINKYNLQPSNRDELIILSLELEHYLQHDIKYLLCVADSDFNFLCGKKYESKYLSYTDYTSADIYLFEVYILDKFFNLGLCIKLNCHQSTLIKNFIKVLQNVFLIRSANEICDWNLKWVNFTTCCKIKKELVVFDEQDFINRYLSKNNCQKRKDEFMDAYINMRSKKVSTYKQMIRGADYLELLAWYTSKKIGKGGNKYRDAEVIRSIILTAVNHEELLKEPLFEKLQKKYVS